MLTSLSTELVERTLGSSISDKRTLISRPYQALGYLKQEALRLSNRQFHILRRTEHSLKTALKKQFKAYVN